MEFYLNNDKIKDKSITKEKLADGVIIDSEATQSEKGLLSAEDKKKIDTMPTTDDISYAIQSYCMNENYTHATIVTVTVKNNVLTAAKKAQDVCTAFTNTNLVLYYIRYSSTKTVYGVATSATKSDNNIYNVTGFLFEDNVVVPFNHTGTTLYLTGDQHEVGLKANLSDGTLDNCYLTPSTLTNSGVITAIPTASTQTWGKGCPQVDTDGVMEVGKYIDMHNSADGSNDFDVRIMCNSSTGNTLVLPHTSGNIALQADVEKLSDQIDDAVTQLNEASEQMNYVNAELNGDVLTVTDKNNVKTSVNLVDNYEKVTVQLSTSVSGVTLNNLTLNVYINHDTNTPITYTTDANGKAEFQVAKGSYYQVTFPDKANCEHIAPIGYTATVSSRTINAEYKKISEEHLETVNVYVRYYNQSTTATAFSGIEVTCTVNGTATKATTDDKGLATFTVAWGKKYTISVPDNYNNYYLWYRSPSTTQTSENSSRALYFNYYPFEAGVFIVTDDGKEYTAEQWKTAGLASDKAVLIKVLTNDLVVNSRTVYIDAQMTQTGYKNAQWQAGNSNYLLTLPDGANTNDGKVVTDGYIASAAAAESGGISTPAMSLAVTYTATVDTSEFRGYLGTGQQWNQFWSNIDLVDECITNIFGDSAKTFQKNYTNAKWTSTQLNSGVAYGWGASLGNLYKYSDLLVVPFLAILPTN